MTQTQPMLVGEQAQQRRELPWVPHVTLSSGRCLFSWAVDSHMEPNSPGRSKSFQKKCLHWANDQVREQMGSLFISCPLAGRRQPFPAMLSSEANASSSVVYDGSSFPGSCHVTAFSPPAEAEGHGNSIQLPGLVLQEHMFLVGPHSDLCESLYLHLVHTHI